MKSCKEYYDEKMAELPAKVEKLAKAGIHPTVCIIQVGEDPASTRYVRNKIKDCEKVGITVCKTEIAENCVEEDIIYEIEYAAGFGCHGVIVQMPLPAHIDANRIKRAIPPQMDVDGFNGGCEPCTPLGIVKWLEWNSYTFTGKNALVIGRSELVGRPLAKMLLDRNSTVTVAHSHTVEMRDQYRGKDLIVCAAGVPGLVEDCMQISAYAVIVDVGTNVVDGKLVGDCKENIWCAYQTPVPGGVGLLTRVTMLENVLELAQDSTLYMPDLDYRPE